MGGFAYPPVATATKSGLVPTPPNNTTTFLRGDATFAAAGGGAPQETLFCTSYEASGRFTTTNTNTGTNTFGTSGVALDTGANATSGTVVRIDGFVGTNDQQAGAGSAQYACSIYTSLIGTDLTAEFGMGKFTATGGAIDFTQQHIAFKIVRAASGAVNVYATQGDGVTENASASLTTVAAEDDLRIVIKVNGTTSADYYYSKNNAALSAATNLTTNLSVNGEYLVNQLTNSGTATESIMKVMYTSLRK